ncbi:PAS domain S-box protein [Legionella sp. km772]|uniref:PAS domain-containing protein n=1 Tax=Legionella sp. km772 TaxID=2498111 RepID=UPI000F8C648A|nr:PAS domain S-box protein [Legionella sp. km772]RUR07508.1 MEKHLA domain-containing protein [Legionella sp. km772]
MNSEKITSEDDYTLPAAIIESSRDAIIASTLQGTITFWNKAAQLLYGYSAEEAINQPLSIIAPPEKKEEINHILNEIREGRIISSYESIRKHKNGKNIPVFVTVSPVKDPEGKVIGASAIFLDISQFKMLEERSNKILEATPDAIVIINQEGKINYINTQTEKLFGYEKRELIGQYVEALLPEPYRSRHPTHRRAFFLNPHSRPMGTGMELYGQRKNLEIFPVEISLSPLDTVDGMVALAAIRDITERKIVEEGFRKILEATPDAIVIINLEGQITFINTQTEKLFGYNKNELIGLARSGDLEQNSGKIRAIPGLLVHSPYSQNGLSTSP